MINDTPEAAAVLNEGGFTLTMPPALLSISISRSAVRRVVTFRDQDAESSFLVALTEIVANAIDEHVRIAQDAPVTLEVRFGTEDVVRVSDAGRGLARSVSDRLDLDHEALGDSFGGDRSRDHTPPGDLAGDAPDERGRGLMLAQALVPSIGFESTAMGTVVTLPLAGFGIVR